METIFVGKNRIFLPEVHSTNSYAIELLKNVKPQEGTLIFTDHQTHGRGQRGMYWNSEPESNVSMSVLLEPNFLSLENTFFLYQIAALACYDALTEIINNSQIDIKIKWPNDILVNRKKICGILIENTILDNRLNCAVIGIGINVNQELLDEKWNATSLINCVGKRFDRLAIMNSICYYLEKNYLNLKQNKFENIQKAYLMHLYGLNEKLLFNYQGKNRILKVVGISASGLLSLIDEDENKLEVDVKDIKWML